MAVREVELEDREQLTKELAQFMIGGFSAEQLITATSAIDQLYSRAAAGKKYTHFEADVFARAAIFAVQTRGIPEQSLIVDKIKRNRNRSLGKPSKAVVQELQNI